MSPASDTPVKFDHLSPAQKWIPSLNGLRALSIYCVLQGHLYHTRGFFLSGENTWGGDYGILGVRFFFVISGFLITTLLIRELKETNTISLKNFYIRRIFRIFPAAFFYIGAIALLNYCQLITLKDNDLIHAVTYTINYHRPRSWYVGHLWSLSVEEQFYLIWPLMMLLLGFRRSMILAVLVILATPAIRSGVYLLLPGSREGIGETFPTIMDTIATGCLLSGIRNTLSKNKIYEAFLSSPFFILVPLAIFPLNNFSKEYPSLGYPVGETVLNLLIALCIDWCITHSKSAVGRFLNSKPLNFIGVLSYSLYLWQQLFINKRLEHQVFVFPVNILLTFACALISYYFVEKYFLSQRERFIVSG